MTKEDIRHEIEKIDQEINRLTETRCTSLVCTTNEYDAALQMQELVEKRTELYYQLNANSSSSKPTMTPEEQTRHQEKIKIAKNLLDVLDEETIATKVGLTIKEIKQLKN